MKLIDINLYPLKAQEYKPITQSLSRFLPAAITLFMALAVINLVVFSMAFISSGKKMLLNREWKASVSMAQTMDSLRKEADSANGSLQRYHDLTGVSTPVASILAAIYNSLPVNIWFSDMNLNENSIILTGFAVKWKEEYINSIDTFVKNLKKEDSLKIFKEMSLNSRKFNIGGREVMKFEIECKNSR